MKNFIAILFIIFFNIGCNKEDGQNNSNVLLSRIMENGKVYQSFEYNNIGQLVKEKFYGMCEQNPSDEYMYLYKGSKVDTLRSVIRSIYSSTSAICNPAIGVQYLAVFEYDNQGRMSKIIKGNNTTSFIYNAQGFIEKQVISGGGNNYISTYKYDTKGNLTEQTDGQGNVTGYEYDNKRNPYYLIRQHPDIITAFVVSQNNVVKINYAGGSHIIKYEYNGLNLPVKMFDSNGSTYQFVYQ